MSEARVNNLSNESSTGGPTISGITIFSGTNFFVPPVGNTAQRPDNPQKGELRFNTDSKHLEYFKGDTIGWSEVEATNEELGGATGATGSGHRGVLMGGSPDNSNGSNIIDYITISTLNNTQDFGDLTQARKSTSVVSSRTRAVCGGGTTPGLTYNILDFITISSTGDALDFGDLLNTKENQAGCSSQTRGVFNGGYQGGASNVIEYITIASTGNGLDFGDTSEARKSPMGVSSSTRSIAGGGYTPSMLNTIDFVITATTGN